MSIADLKEKIKGLGEDKIHNILVVLIIISVAFSSFALGRLSVEKGSQAQILYPDEVVERAKDSQGQNLEVVASSRGSKYYYPWCSGAENLSQSNLIEFGSAIEAENVGYTLATNCDGPNS